MIHWNSTSYQYLVLLTDVYLSLDGTVIPNHGYVEISRIGSTDDFALLCHTNNPPAPGSPTSGGDWWAPDGNRVGGTPPIPGFTRTRAAMVVRLRRASGTPPEGIYLCTIQDAASTFQSSVYVGLYNTGEGIIQQRLLDRSTKSYFQAASLYLLYLHTMIPMNQLLSSPSPVSPLEDLLPLSLGPETPSLSLKELRLC